MEEFEGQRGAGVEVASLSPMTTHRTPLQAAMDQEAEGEAGMIVAAEETELAVDVEDQSTPNRAQASDRLIPPSISLRFRLRARR